MKENPAKVFLRQYLAVSGRVQSLKMTIDRELAKAENISFSLKEIKVLSSPAEHDPMAANVCSAVDATVILQEEIDRANLILRDILISINSLNDERQKELLTRRYVQGQNFPDIQAAMHYEKTQMYVIHGRALLGINEWLSRRANNERANEHVRHVDGGRNTA